MAKSRYQIQKDRIHKLPIISEDSILSKTPRSLKAILNHPGEGSTVVRTPRNPVVLQKLDPESILRNRSLGHPRKEVRFQDEASGNRIEDLINNYLHYARYGADLPVYDGLDSTYKVCPCCKERNIQNMMLGRKGPFRGLPVKQAKIVELEDTDASYKSVLDEKQNPDTRDFRFESDVETSPRSSWMHYQPLPYASHYLSPEFNRPSVVIDYVNYASDGNLTSKEDDAYRRVKDAATKYKGAMSKVKGTVSAIEGSGENDYQRENNDYDFPYSYQTYTHRDYFA